MTTLSRPLQIADILAHFNYHKAVSNMALRQYCDRMKFDFLSEGQYQDNLFQYNHDRKALVIIPEILEALTEYQYIPDFISDSKRKELDSQNEVIEMKIATLCEDNGLTYREIDVLLKNFGAELQARLNNSANRLNNMCASAISHVAQEQFGDELSIKVLAEYQRKLSTDKIA